MRRRPSPAPSGAPCSDYTALRRPLFGDLHVHTALSFDASSQDTRNQPADAYRFARGAAMGIQPYDENGHATRTIQLDRPLDFTAVTDHSEFLGEVHMCTTAGAPGYWHPVCMIHRYLPRYSFWTFGAAGLSYKHRWGLCGANNEICAAQSANTWQDIQHAAEDAYDRTADCQFTSFVGYEWTAGGETGQNLHHNVIFRNAQVPDRAMSWLETPSQVQLWDYLDAECVAGKPGCDAVVIPHNSNLSGGLMFESARITNGEIPGAPVTAAEATRRARWNTLFEVVQHKGASECDSRLPSWSEDEFCDFELLGYDRFGGKNTGALRFATLEWLSPVLGSDLIPATTPPAEANFLRYALEKGLRQQAELGVNSFKFGLIGSTDTHIAAPGRTMEKNHPGHGGAGMGARDGVPTGLPDELEYNPGGLAVLYAEENSRDALFAAMQRREAYATSGTRPELRLFGGWDYPDDLCAADDMVARGYAGGVPMGGDLPPADGPDRAPRFLVSATMDAGTREYPGSPLQRIQLIKGWYADGELHQTAGCGRRRQRRQQRISILREPAWRPRPVVHRGGTRTSIRPRRLFTTPAYHWKTRAVAGASASAPRPGCARRIRRAFPRAWKKLLRAGASPGDPGTGLEFAHLVHAADLRHRRLASGGAVASTLYWPRQCAAPVIKSCYGCSLDSSI
ncbi:MAG: DUF3604 domain-containing protein [Halioglobus sp.]